MTSAERFGCVFCDGKVGYFGGGEAGFAVGLGGGGEDAVGVGDGVGFVVWLEGDSGDGDFVLI